MLTHLEHAALRTVRVDARQVHCLCDHHVLAADRRLCVKSRSVLTQHGCSVGRLLHASLDLVPSAPRPKVVQIFL